MRRYSAFHLAGACVEPGAQKSVRNLAQAKPYLHPTFWTEVVDADIPLLMGLDLLDKYQLVADNVNNILTSKVERWSIPITHQHGHLFIQWNLGEMLYARGELEQLHLQFFYPSHQKLLNVLRRGTPDEIKGDTSRLSQEIVGKCDGCKRFGIRLCRFRVSFHIKKSSLIMYSP